LSLSVRTGYGSSLQPPFSNSVLGSLIRYHFLSLATGHHPLSKTCLGQRTTPLGRTFFHLAVRLSLFDTVGSESPEGAALLFKRVGVMERAAPLRTACKPRAPWRLLELERTLAAGNHYTAHVMAPLFQVLKKVFFAPALVPP